MHHIPRHNPVKATPSVSDEKRAVWIHGFSYTDQPPFREEHLNDSSQGVVKLTPGIKYSLEIPCTENLVPLLDPVQQGLEEMNPRYRFAKTKSKGSGQVSDRNRKLILLRVHIYADPKNNKADSTRDEGSLCQNARNLPTGKQNIVWPFELRSHSRFLYGRSDAHTRD